MSLAKECQAKEGASDGDIAEAMAFKMPTTPAGKCLHACAGEKLGVVSQIYFESLVKNRTWLQILFFYELEDCWQ